MSRKRALKRRSESRQSRIRTVVFLAGPGTTWILGGFVEMARLEVGESTDENLRGIEFHGREITDEFNELESLVLEGTKPG